jgi:hypothetical protein
MVMTGILPAGSAEFLSCSVHDGKKKIGPGTVLTKKTLGKEHNRATIMISTHAVRKKAVLEMIRVSAIYATKIEERLYSF